jgi:hypothetical protein
VVSTKVALCRQETFFVVFPTTVALCRQRTELLGDDEVVGLMKALTNQSDEGPNHPARPGWFLGESDSTVVR